MRKRDIQKILNAANEQISEALRELREPQGELEVQHLNSTRINGRLEPLRKCRQLLEDALKGNPRLFSGTCKVCGEDIGMERLLTFPETRSCTKHA